MADSPLQIPLIPGEPLKPSGPFLYFNLFQVSASPHDFTFSLYHESNLQINLVTSYVAAKSLANSILELVAQLENVTGQPILSTAEFLKLMAEKAQGGSNEAQPISR